MKKFDIDKSLNKVIAGDCLEVLRSIPSDSIDMTFADPPFNLKKKYSSYSDSLEVSDYLSWCDEWLKEIARITKPSGSIFVHNIPKWLSFYAGSLNQVAEFRHWIAWNAPTSPMGKSLQPNHYGILYYVKNSKLAIVHELRSPHERERKSPYLRKDYGGKKAGIHPFGPLVSDVWNDIHRLKHKKYRDEHPCQLPIPLLERLILMSTEEGQIILDPFMGTGTTAVAASRMNRKFIGIDISEDYVDITKSNVKKHGQVSHLGGIIVSYNLGDVKTIRNEDWDDLQEFFEIPSDMKQIDFIKPVIRKEFISDVHILG